MAAALDIVRQLLLPGKQVDGGQPCGEGSFLDPIWRGVASSMKGGLSTTAAAILYSVAGTLLTLVNKVAIRAFPYASLLVAVQNLISIALLVGSCALWPERLGKLPPLTREAERRWAPLSALFVVMLVSSLLALKYISAVTLVVLRNLTTLIVAFGERYFLQTRPSGPAVLSLVGMLLAAALYGVSDLSFDRRGYAWILINIIASSAYQVHVKHLVDSSSQSVGPLGMSFYNNVLSLPMLIVTSVLMGEATSIADDIVKLGTIASLSTCVTIVMSGVCGFVLSTSAFVLNKLVSATSIMVINNANKFAVILLSELFMERSLGPLSTFGTAMVLYFAYVYSLCPKRPRCTADAAKNLTGSNSSPSPSDVGGTAPTGPKQNKHSKSTLVMLGSLPVAVGACAILFAGRLFLTAWTESARKVQAAAALDQSWESNPYQAFPPRNMAKTAQDFPAGVVYMPPSQPYWLKEYGHCPKAKASKLFNLCDDPCAEPESYVKAVPLGAPERTSKGELTVDLIDKLLRYAWGPRPPSVDLYVRTGCHGAQEAQALFSSIRLFWPRFLGKIIVVMDKADAAFASRFLPTDPLHSYEVRFESVPCMTARIFNQVSYMMADLQSEADYIVTIDSDCVIHSPVTPDLLFRDGKLRLGHSRFFQAGFWDSMVDYFFEPGAFWSHTMVMQPVPFHRSTFRAFRDWNERVKGECYIDRVVDMEHSPLLKSWKRDMRLMPFCWMCQLGTFLNATRETWDLYDYVDLDSQEVMPYQRMAIHTPYELDRPKGKVQMALRNREVVEQGLCRAFGRRVFPHCAGVNTTYLDTVTFHYSHWYFNHTPEAKAATLYAYKSRIRWVMKLMGYY